MATPGGRTEEAHSPTQRADDSEPAAAAPAADAALQDGEMVAERYRIVRFLAHGGMGEVYEADDQLLGEKVALKTVRAEISNDDIVLRRFRREIQLAHKVTHPNVCRIFDLGFQKRPRDVTFLTMELLPGETLAARVRRARMTTAEARPLVGQMAAALSAAHRAGVIHRDFKSQNVMLVPGAGGERAVITDFGLARQDEPGDGSISHRGGTGLLGTPAYMAPEQVTGADITPRTDIYALGVVMYEMVTGKLPFQGNTPLSTAVKRVAERPEPPREHVADLPPRWDEVIMRCLATRPEERFADAEEVAAALAERHRRGPLIAALAVAVVAVAATVFLVTRPGEPPPPAPAAPPRVANVVIPPAPPIYSLPATLAIRANVPARIVVDDRVVAEAAAEARVDVAPGKEHEVVVSAARYAPFHGKFSAAAGATTPVAAQLEPIAAPPVGRPKPVPASRPSEPTPVVAPASAPAPARPETPRSRPTTDGDAPIEDLYPR